MYFCSDESNTSALHISSRATTTEETELLAKHFLDIDYLDNDHRTPAFMAAAAGRLKNLIVLFGRGANLNHIVTCLEIKLSSSSLAMITYMSEGVGRANILCCTSLLRRATLML